MKKAILSAVIGSILLTGCGGSGDNSPSPHKPSSIQKANIDPIVSGIFSNDAAFAALKADGSVVIWGNSSYGGNSASVQSQLTDVVNIFSSNTAFAALKADGSVVTWGASRSGGDSASVQSQLTDVVNIFPTEDAFAALKADGSVVTWGNGSDGGDSASVTKELSMTGQYSDKNDVDHDGISDKAEMDVCINALSGGGYPTQPRTGLAPCTIAGNPDSDGDGIKDGVEQKFGLNPLTPNTNAINAIEQRQAFDNTQPYEDARHKDSHGTQLSWRTAKP